MTIDIDLQLIRDAQKQATPVTDQLKELIRGGDRVVVRIDGATFAVMREVDDVDGVMGQL